MDAANPTVDAVASSDDASAAVPDSSASPEASTAVDAGAGDASSADSGNMAQALCAMICSGCCDSMGKCKMGNALMVCGTGGAACNDCTLKQCPLAEAGCCGAGGCGCAVGGLVGCN